MIKLFSHTLFTCHHCIFNVSFVECIITYEKRHSCNDSTRKRKKKIKCSLKHQRNRSQADERMEHHPMFQRAQNLPEQK